MTPASQPTPDQAIQEAVRVLRAANPRISMADAVTYATAWTEYVTADENIRANGTVVAHPKTGAPITNPYLPVRADAMKRMASVRGISADVLWQRRSGL
ncbi:MAG: P27 family phage terminase small subunit [Gemmatimonadaceae bacterium]|nr:P27 family phage terminase small subunit [Gemmatimonadaceae bacterium]